jgi:hypothetical protein
VGPRGEPRRSDLADDLALADALTLLDQDAAHVGVAALVSRGVADAHERNSPKRT